GMNNTGTTGGMGEAPMPKTPEEKRNEEQNEKDRNQVKQELDKLKGEGGDAKPNPTARPEDRADPAQPKPQPMAGGEQDSPPKPAPEPAQPGRPDAEGRRQHDTRVQARGRPGEPRRAGRAKARPEAAGPQGPQEAGPTVGDAERTARRQPGHRQARA